MEKADNVHSTKARLHPRSIATVAAATSREGQTHRAVAAAPAAETTSPTPTTTNTAAALAAEAARIRKSTTAERCGSLCSNSFPGSHLAPSEVAARGREAQQQQLKELGSSSNNSKQQQQRRQRPTGRHQREQQMQPPQQQLQPEEFACGCSSEQQQQHPMLLRQLQQRAVQQSPGRSGGAELTQRQQHSKRAQQTTKHLQQQYDEKGEPQKAKHGGAPHPETTEKKDEKDTINNTQQQQEEETTQRKEGKKKEKHQQEKGNPKKKRQQGEEEQRQQREEQVEEKKVFGSGIQTVGGETPVEQSPEEKFIVEKDTLLCESILWKMLQEYYKQVAIAAWSQEVVPSFVTSNSRLCRSYACIIFGFLQDWYAKVEKERIQQEEKGKKRQEKVDSAQKKLEKKQKDVQVGEEATQQNVEQQQRREQQKRSRQEGKKRGQRQQAAVDKQLQEKEKQRRQGTQQEQQQEGQQLGKGIQPRQANTQQSQEDRRPPERKEEHTGQGKKQPCKEEGGSDEKKETFARETACSDDEDVLPRRGGNEMLVWKQSLRLSDASPASATCAFAASVASVAAGEAAGSSASTPKTTQAATSPSVSAETPWLPASVTGHPTSASTSPSSSFLSFAAAGSEGCSTTAAEQQSRVLILEIGGGHGRFTFLLLKALLQFRSLFGDLGMPPFPFLYVFSDVAAANVCFCEQHPALQEFVEEGWLDFATFDGNESTGEIFLRKRKEYVAKGTPIVAIANYVFDSLLTDAWRITPGAAAEYHRAGISIYSPRVEKDRLNPDIMLRMSVGWHWHPVEDLSLVFPPAYPDPTSADAEAVAARGMSADPAAGGGGALLSAASVEAPAKFADSADPYSSFPHAATASWSAASSAAPTRPLSELNVATSFQSSAAAAAVGSSKGCCAEAGDEGPPAADQAEAAKNRFLVSCSPPCNSCLKGVLTTEEQAQGSGNRALSMARGSERKDDEGEKGEQRRETDEDRQSECGDFKEQSVNKWQQDRAVPLTATNTRNSSCTYDCCSHSSSTVSSSSSKACDISGSRFSNRQRSTTTRSSSFSPIFSSRSSSVLSLPGVPLLPGSSSSPSRSTSLSSRCSWKTDPAVRRVLEKYREMNRVLSLVLPVGAFSLFRALLQLSNYNFFCLIGDKGYPSPEEFAGERDPHIAVHGSVSFMLNLHAIRLYFDCIGGFSMATPYRDTFQVTALWCCTSSSSDDSSSDGESSRSSSKCKKEMPRSRAAFLADAEDMPPDSLIQWQRSCQEREVGIKEALALLRYSGHDPDVYLHLASSIVKQCVQPFINPRTEQDILFDLEKVHGNWYKLKKGEDLPDACAHVCMKLGQCASAIHYLKASTTQCTETLHASTFVNLAACHKVLGQFQEGIRCCEQALLLQPRYPQAQEMRSTLQMCQQPFRVALVGLGYWMRMEAVHLLRREKRVKIVAVYSYKEADASQFVSQCLASPGEEGTEEKIDVYAGAAGFQQLLQRQDIHAVVLDVHAQLTPWFLSRVLQSKKHILTRSPLALSLSTGWNLINMYKPHAAHVVWHAVDNARTEEAFFQAKELLQQIGSLCSFSLHCVTHTLVLPGGPAAAPTNFSTFPYSIKQHLALELLRCIVAVRTITGEQLLGLGCVFNGREATANGGEEKGKETEDREDLLPSASREAPHSTSHKKQTCSAAPVAAVRSGATAGSSAPVGSEASPAHAPRSHVHQKESPLLTGWLELSGAGDCSKRIPGSFVVTNAAGDSSVKYTFLCTGGALELTRSISSWKLKWTNEDSFFSPATHSIATQSIGHQNSHDAWLTDLFHATCGAEETEKHTAVGGKDENWGLVDVTVNAALADCAIIEAILGSIQKEGSPARFASVNKTVI